MEGKMQKGDIVHLNCNDRSSFHDCILVKDELELVGQTKKDSMVTFRGLKKILKFSENSITFEAGGSININKVMMFF